MDARWGREPALFFIEWRKAIRRRTKRRRRMESRFMERATSKDWKRVAAMNRTNPLTRPAGTLSPGERDGVRANDHIEGKARAHASLYG